MNERVEILDDRFWVIVLSLLHDLLKETVKMVTLESQELQFFLALFLIDFSTLNNTLLGSLDALLNHNDLILLADAFILLRLFHLLKVSLSMLCLLLFTHSESHGALIECLVGLSRRLDVIPDAEQKETAFRRYLSNEFIKALSEKFLTNWADAS